MPQYYWFNCKECGLEAYRYRNLKVCPRCHSRNIEREEPIDFRAACWNRGSRNDLQMFAHRNKKKQMVGWIFVCSKCAPGVRDRDLIVEFAQP
jgi:hypothetical protein